MHLTFRRANVLVYRSTCVPKRSAGNTHGFSRQVYVGSIAIDGPLIPDALIQRLTGAEIAFVEAKVCSPARERAAEQRRIEERREHDPGWRLEEATRLVVEAADLSRDDVMPATKVVTLQGPLVGIQTDGAVSQATTADSVEEARCVWL
jgi:hypothetical protein